MAPIRKRTSMAKLKPQRLRSSPSVTRKSWTGLKRCPSRNEKTPRSFTKHNGNITSRKSNISANRFQTAEWSCSRMRITLASSIGRMKSFEKCAPFWASSLTPGRVLSHTQAQTCASFLIDLRAQDGHDPVLTTRLNEWQAVLSGNEHETDTLESVSTTPRLIRRPLLRSVLLRDCVCTDL